MRGIDYIRIDLDEKQRRKKNSDFATVSFLRGRSDDDVKADALVITAW